MPGTLAKNKESKNQRRRAAKKAKKQEVKYITKPTFFTYAYRPKGPLVSPNSGPPVADIDIEPAAPSPESKGIFESHARNTDESEFRILEDDPLYIQFKGVLDKFHDLDEDIKAVKIAEKPAVYYDDDDDIPDEENDDIQDKISKKKRKEQTKLSVAELKALVKKPDLVEWTDTSAPDPRTLVAIKSYRNVVPVPAHWSLKREYLSSKRGVEKAPFALPKFLQDTGISEMRDAVLEKQEQASLKQKQRERVQPKMGKLDIDYGKLYEAFFRFQTKPEMTRFGEVYYEGKEYETNLKHLRPGDLSDELREALQIPPGLPPPWLVPQQRFGPPPSYPALRIAGLNAPIPPGASWGYHPGGFGKPPLDEAQRPLYGGDVLGELEQEQNQPMGEPVERTLWGELTEPAEDEDEEDEDEDIDEEEGAGDDDEADMAAGTQSTGGIKSVSGFTSVQPSEYGGMESIPEDFTLRKQRKGTETEELYQRRTAGQIIPEQDKRTQGFFGSDRGYDLRATLGNHHLPILDQEQTSRKRKAGDMDVSIDLEALPQGSDKLSKEQIQKQYEAQKKAEQGGWSHKVDQDDLSNMIAQESSKRLRKDEERRSRR